jgi:hypothetical protein
MCQAPHPKRRAVASVPAPCAVPPNDDDDNDNAFSKIVSDEVTSLPSPCAAPPNDNNDDDDAFSKSVSDVDSLCAEGLVMDMSASLRVIVGADAKSTRCAVAKLSMLT